MALKAQINLTLRDFMGNNYMPAIMILLPIYYILYVKYVFTETCT